MTIFTETQLGTKIGFFSSSSSLIFAANFFQAGTPLLLP